MSSTIKFLNSYYQLLEVPVKTDQVSPCGKMIEYVGVAKDKNGEKYEVTFYVKESDFDKATTVAFFTTDQIEADCVIAFEELEF